MQQTRQQGSQRPTVAGALRRIAQEDDLGAAEIKRLVVIFRANGDAIYRAFPADGSDYIGGSVST